MVAQFRRIVNRKVCAFFLDFRTAPQTGPAPQDYAPRIDLRRRYFSCQKRGRGG